MPDSPARVRLEERVRALEAMGHRGSATAAEARAATWLRDHMQELGLDAGLEPFEGESSGAIRPLLHVVIAALGLPWLWLYPTATALIGVGVLASFLMEFHFRRPLLGRFLITERSRNVVGRLPAAGTPRGRIVVVAHYDTQKTGRIWDQGLQERVGPWLHRLPGPLRSPMGLVLIAFAVQWILGLAVLNGSTGWLIVLTALVLLAVYALSCWLLADWAGSPSVPGANDNATGVALALALAEEWVASPVLGVDLEIVLTGCEESGLHGADAWAQAHAHEAEHLPLAFLNLDSFGYGPPAYVMREHSLAGVPVTYPQSIGALCRRAAREANVMGVRPRSLPVYTDGLALLGHGLEGATLMCLPEDDLLPNYHQMTDTSDRLYFDAAEAGLGYARAVLAALAERVGGRPS